MMPQSTNTYTQYELKHYAMFAGKCIARVELLQVEGGFGYLPTFTFTDGTFAQVYCDPECNGPGWVGLYAPCGTEIVPNYLKTGDFNTTTTNETLPLPIDKRND